MEEADEVGETGKVAVERGTSADRLAGAGEAGEREETGDVAACSCC